MTDNRPIDRLLLYLDYKGIKPARAEKDLDLSNGYLKNALKRDGVIGSQILERIYKVCVDLNLIWLITGIGEMLIDDEKAADTPHGTITLSDPKVGYITNTPTTSKGIKTPKAPKLDPPTDPPSRFFAPKIVTVDRFHKENILYVPVRARAGYLTGYGDQEFIESLPSFNLPGLPHGSYRAFEVDGDSMHPTLKNREMVIGQWVESLDHMRDDRVYILVTKNDGIVIKRTLNRIEKHSIIVAKSDALDNRNLYPNLQVKPEEIQEIWYAVWHGGFDFQSPADTWKRINNHEADITVLQNTVKLLTDIIKAAGLIK